jgi:8-oxo-dGTP pyrophosphatase MutT (NUDIX family)
MQDRLKCQIERFLQTTRASKKVVERFLERMKEGNFTRDENPMTHFCVYFAAYDSTTKEIFIGHHKKSGLWLFNGGHIDKGETADEALKREMNEEWGIEIDLRSISPSLLTVTDIVSNPNGRPCKIHFDIWHFIPVHKTSFSPEKEKLNTEFYRTKWLDIQMARSLVKDLATLEALDFLEKL